MLRQLCLVVSLLSAVSFADPGMKSVNDVSFMAVGPAGLKINGQTKSIEVKGEGEELVLRVPLDTIDTGIDLRNKHMKEKYLETGTHPFAELKISKASLKEGSGQKGKGMFKCHGKEKDVAVTYDVAKVGEGLSVKGSFDINLKDYAIDIPSYLGVTVKPDVKVNASFVVAP